MGAWLWAKKGYVVHGLIIAVIFLDPSVQHYVAQHAATTGTFSLGWGWLLHWAEGKSRQPFNTQNFQNPAYKG
jgi:hypothetical protein